MIKDRPVDSPPSSISMGTAARRRRLSPLMVIGLSVPVVLLLLAGGIFFIPRALRTHAANGGPNPDCAIIVPQNPLSARGLATPYQLTALDPINGPCNEANPAQGAFVQGAILDLNTGQISLYNPLVIDQGTQPAAMPVVPRLPARAVVGLWFGFNGGTLTLKGDGNSLRQGQCINGINGSIFGQVAFCNAPSFFAFANVAIRSGRLKVPQLGTGADGLPCPTVRDFSVVDQDQSDNVTTTYLVTPDGRTAQMTAANAGTLQNTQTLANASDNRLVSVALDGALGCSPWKAPDLADNGNLLPSEPLNELLAATRQAQPTAMVPAGDPMVLNNNNPNVFKLNLYRIGVDQSIVFNINRASTKTYCQNMLNIGPARMQKDQQFTQNRPSPDPAAANSLFTFLAQRFNASIGQDNLNCTGLLNITSPITVTTDANGVATNATFANAGGNNGGNTGTGTGTNTGTGTGTGTNMGTGTGTGTNTGTGTGTGTNTGTGTGTGTNTGTGTGTGTNTGTGTGTGTVTGNTAINCTINGTVLPGCTGTTNINGQPCTFAVDNTTTNINVTCQGGTPTQQNPPAQNQQQPQGQSTPNQQNQTGQTQQQQAQQALPTATPQTGQ